MIQINNLHKWIEKNNKLFVALFFLLFFIIGVDIYKDYGISWDENLQWKNNGYANYNFVVHNDKETLLNGNDKYHGPAFELVLIILEKTLHLSDSRDIFLMRHFTTFFVFFISSLFFYFLSLKLFKNWKLAFVGSLIYVLSPPIFSHSFYNSKDLIFLSFFTISIYTLIIFYEKQNYLRTILFALITAFTIDIRIIGIMIPAITLCLVSIEIVFSIYNKTKLRLKVFHFFLYLILMLLLIILFWPVLWLNPMYHFLEAIKENSFYPWSQPVLYFGKDYYPTTLPWHYLLFWIFISKPIVYSILFLIGTIAIITTIILSPIHFLKEKQNEMIILLWFFLPLVFVLLFKGVVFDTGRHLYFMHGGFVLIAVYGLQMVYKILQQKKVGLYFTNAFLFISFSSVIYSMVKLHPYEHLYFNASLENNMQKIKNNFEFDYWGLSSREVLENILIIDTSKQIKIYAENIPGIINAEILPEEQRSRLIYTDSVKEAKYFIADYRWTKEENYAYHRSIYSAKIGNTKINTAFIINSP
jgi:hypothetical protein